MARGAFSIHGETEPSMREKRFTQSGENGRGAKRMARGMRTVSPEKGRGRKPDAPTDKARGGSSSDPGESSAGIGKRSRARVPRGNQPRSREAQRMSQSERRTPTDLGLREIMHEIPDRKRTIRGSFALDLPCGVEETTLSSPVSPPLSSAQIERHPIFRSPFSFVSIDSCSNAQRHPAPPRSSGARPPATSVVCTVVVRPTVQMAEVDAPSLPGSPHVIQPPFARWTGTERFLSVHPGDVDRHEGQGNPSSNAPIPP